MKRLAFVLSTAALLALAACGESPTPASSSAAVAKAADAPSTVPVMKGTQLVFGATHPQLAQLGIVAAAPGKAVSVDLPARLVWNEERTQRLYAAFAGRVMKINADVGQVVKPGTTLAQLASPDFGVAQADTAKAQIDSRLSQKTLQRQRELFEAGIIARKDLDIAEADAARSGAEIQRAEARTKMYGGAAGAVNQNLSLVSSIGGVVVERNLTPGQELRPDQAGPGVPPLFVVSDPGMLWVQIDARESEAGTLRPGAMFRLMVPALPGETFEGRVTAAADFIDPNTRTIKIRGVVPNPERKLKAEMLATARVERTLGSGVIVPAQAVLLNGTGHSIMVEVQPGVFEPREVTLGYQGPKEVVVTRGLEAGERIASENVLLLARQYRLARESSGASDGKVAEAAEAKTVAGKTAEAKAGEGK